MPMQQFVSCMTYRDYATWWYYAAEADSAIVLLLDYSKANKELNEADLALIDIARRNRATQPIEEC